MKYLTVSQLHQFRAAQRKVLIGLGTTFVYCAAIYVASRFLTLEPCVPWLAGGFFLVTVFLIWSTRGYRCPVCNQMPQARMFSVGASEVAHSRMVSLFPKTCSGCGVRFSLPRDR